MVSSVASAAIRRLVQNRHLRALMGACTGFYAGGLAYFVLLVIYVFEVGGAPAVGQAVVLNMLPGGLIGPVAATLATSRRPHLHLALGIGFRAAISLASMVAVLSSAPVGVLLVLVAAGSFGSAAVRPLHGALVVRASHTASEAAAANVVTALLSSGSALVGPALAGAALGVWGIGWAFGVPIAMFVFGAGMALGVSPTAGEREATGGDIGARSEQRRRHQAGFGAAVRSQLAAVGLGFRAIAARPPAAAAMVMFVVNVLLFGVWYVVSAPVANDQLRLGEGGIAAITTVYGAGALLGGLATLSMVGMRNLAPVLAGAVLGWAACLALIGMVGVPALGLALAAAVGAAGAVTYAILPTLVQRSVARTAIVPASASLHSLYAAGFAVGAAITPVLVDSFGVMVALFILSGAVVVITAAVWPQLRRADALSAEDAAKLTVLRAAPSLNSLTPLALEQLARSAIQLTVPAGGEVVRQGDAGNRYYVIVAGLAEVTVDERRVATLGPGGSFGEIALLHDVPRSATVTALEDLDLIVVERAEFLTALSSDGGRLGGMAQARLTTAPVEQRLAEIDREAALGDRSIAGLLAAQPTLAAIGPPAISELADAARVLHAPGGALITREGDYGDTYYVILDGAADVTEGERPVRKLRPGDGFGEQAILRDVPRTASVRAVGDTTLLAVDREAFQRARQAV